MSENNAVERFWYPASKKRNLLYFFLFLVNLPFSLLVKLKRVIYKSGLVSSKRFDKPVLVVGNITVGGTGKTPFISELVKLLQHHNIKPGLVSRGYLAKCPHFPHQVVKTDSAMQVGDEAYMLINQLNIPFVIDPNRSRAVEYLVKNNNVDIVISDDGLQHYKMSRDLEILLVDSTRMFGNQLILPFGPLREPTSRCKSVDLIIQNGARASNHLEDFQIDHQVLVCPKQLINIHSKKAVNFDKLHNKKITAIAGIGNPNRFYASLNKLAPITKKYTFPDHHEFKQSDFDDINNNASAEEKHGFFVMTEKDAVKCNDLVSEKYYYLSVEMKFENALINELLSRVKDTIERKNDG